MNYVPHPLDNYAECVAMQDLIVNMLKARMGDAAVRFDEDVTDSPLRSRIWLGDSVYTYITVNPELSTRVAPDVVLHQWYVAVSPV